MSISPQSAATRAISIEILEDRIALNASPALIAKALDLPAGTAVIYAGDAGAVSTFTYGTTGGIVGFPSGADNDFFVLSTGVSSGVFNANSGGGQGTDLGAKGVAGDTGTVNFSLNVPVSSLDQKFKFDFVFLSEEYPEYVGSKFNDIFTASVNGQNIAKDQFGNVISVNNAFFSGESAAGTFFDGRTSKLTASYTVPAGTAKLDIQLEIGDVGDGIYDSAVFIDNVRFETSQVIFVDFDGRTVTNHIGAGTSVNIPAFQASNVGSAASTDTVIANILNGLRQKYAAYDVVFTTTEPTSGTYATLVIGGHNDLPVDISAANPVFKAKFASATPSIREVLEMKATSTLFGIAAAVDIGNLVRKDLALIFSDVFDEFYDGETSSMITDRLVVTAAHELGHNLGLRHIVNSQPQDIMKQNSPRNPDATFGNTQLTLSEGWTDGAVTQNDDAYLKSILGASDGTTTLVQSIITLQDTINGFFGAPIFNFTLQFDTHSGDIDDGTDAAPLILTLDKFDGKTPLNLPVLPLDTKVSFYGSTTKGGPANLFSGTPTSGNLDPADTFFDLFDQDGNIAFNIPTAKGAPGALESAGMFSMSNDVLPKNTAKFVDADGDIVTVKLTGPGVIGVVQDDADGDSRGGLEKLTLVGTDPTKSNLSISVQKFGGTKANPAKGIPFAAPGDGFVDVGHILGIDDAGLKSIKAAKADLTGAGIEFAGAVGAITLHDLHDGTDVTTGEGPDKYKSSFTARDIEDGSSLNFGTVVSAFTAARVGAGEIIAPEIVSLKIKGDTKAAIAGDLKADVTVDGTLGSANIAGQVSDATIVAKNVNSFTANSFADSSLFAGFVPDTGSDPLAGGNFDITSIIKSFTIKSMTDGFANSFLGAANIGAISIASIIADNGGTRFGVISDVSLKSVKIKDPMFAFDDEGSNDQSLTDFHVIRV